MKYLKTFNENADNSKQEWWDKNNVALSDAVDKMDEPDWERLSDWSDDEVFHIRQNNLRTQVKAVFDELSIDQLNDLLSHKGNGCPKCGHEEWDTVYCPGCEYHIN